MCLRFVFLLTTRLAAWLQLSRREETWKAAEILILRHQLAVLQRRQPRRPKLNWADRALLAALLSVIPKARRHGLRLLVTPDTILRWHRDIVRRRQAASSAHGSTGRPATRRNIRALVLRLARQNPEWGYRRIHGELAGPGVTVAAPAVWEILQTSGTGPAPRRTGPAWSQFLRSQAEAILACDFLTVDLPGGTQAYVLAVIEHATRRIRILGVTLQPSGDWTAQQARNLLMDLGEQAHKVKFMIRDRGSNFTSAFDAVLADAGIRTVLCNVRTPRMNANRRTLDRRMPPRAPGPPSQGAQAGDALVDVHLTARLICPERECAAGFRLGPSEVPYPSGVTFCVQIITSQLCAEAARRSGLWRPPVTPTSHVQPCTSTDANHLGPELPAIPRRSHDDAVMFIVTALSGS